MTTLRKLQHLAPWLLLPAVLLWALWPLVANSWGSVVDTRTLYPAVWPTIEPDIWLQIWILAWGSHILVTAPLGLYQANAFHPTANVLARSDHLLGILPLYAPAYWLSGNPVFAFQFAMIASYLLCGIGFYLLLRHFGCRRGVGLGFAILWALMDWRLNDGLARAQLLQYQYLPLIVLFLDRFLGRGRRRDLAAAGLFLLWQCLTAYWHAYFAIYTAVVTVLVSLLLPGRERDGRRYAMVLGLLVVVGALLTAISLPYVEMAGEGQFIPKSVPAQLRWYFGGPSFPPWISWVAVATIALLAATRDAALRRAGSVFLLVAAAGILLSLPTQGEGLPWWNRWLAMPRELAIAVVPGFRYLRDEYRFLTLASLGIYGLAALGVDTTARALAKRSPLLGVAALVVFFAVAAQPLARIRIPLVPAPSTDTAPPVYRWLGEHGEGGTVLEVPISRNLADAHLDAKAMFFSTYDWLPLINGYTGHPPRAYYEKMRALAATLPDPQAIDELVSATGLRWIVLRGGPEAGFDARGWSRSPRLKLVGDFDGVSLVEVLR